MDVFFCSLQKENIIKRESKYYKTRKIFQNHKIIVKIRKTSKILKGWKYFKIADEDVDGGFLLLTPKGAGSVNGSGECFSIFMKPDILSDLILSAKIFIHLYKLYKCVVCMLIWRLKCCLMLKEKKISKPRLL